MMDQLSIDAISEDSNLLMGNKKFQNDQNKTSIHLKQLKLNVNLKCCF